MLGSVLMAVALTLESALRANRDTRTPMLVAIVVTAVKLGLNGVLIFGAFGFRASSWWGGDRDRRPPRSRRWRSSPSCSCASPAAPPRLDAPTGSPHGSCSPSCSASRCPAWRERLVMNLALLSYFGVLGQYGTVAVAAYTIGVRVLAFSWIPAPPTPSRSPPSSPVPRRRRPRGRDPRGLAGGHPRPRHLGGPRPGLRLRRDPLSRLFTQDADTIAALGPSCCASPSPSPSSSSTSPSAASIAAPATLDAAGCRLRRQLGVPRALRVLRQRDRRGRAGARLGGADPRPRGPRRVAPGELPARQVAGRRPAAPRLGA